jgi:DUF4097 and DUF4098 domain-containing protein YvlB
MSSYPPPPPSNPGPPNYGQYPSNSPNPASYNRDVWKAQRRAMKQQARAQRDMARMQMRAMKRRSIVGPLFLLALGVVFLLAQMGKLSYAEAAIWYGRWWPLVLVAAGLVLLAEWALDQQMHARGGAYRGRVLGGGVVVLLVFMAIAGVGSRASNPAWMWKDRHFGSGFPGFDVALGERHDFDDSLSSPIASGGSLLIRNPHGDVTVTGSSDDGQVHVSVHKEAFARTDDGAAVKETQLQPTFSHDGTNLTLNVATVEGGQADLTVQVPRTTMLTVRADHGDIDIQEVHAAVSVSANSGDVNLSGIDGAVSAHVNDENSSFAAHSVTGTILLDGRAGDITVTDVTGPVTLAGDFFGTTHLEQINGVVSFKTSRTQFQAARIDGDFDVALDSELEANQVLGPVTLSTRDRAITLDRVQGNVQISNRNGAVSLTEAAPLGQIEIDNSHGSVDLGVPGGAGFVMNAQTRNGDVENDFGLKQQGSDDRPTLMGTVGSGGPSVKINTTDGDITVRKAMVAPLPPAAPTPKIVVAPAPKMPALPKMPKLPKAPPVAEASPDGV